MINFKNKKILITGATGGIGNELVKKFDGLEGSVMGTGTNPEKLDLIKKKYPGIKVRIQAENWLRATSPKIKINDSQISVWLLCVVGVLKFKLKPYPYD